MGTRFLATPEASARWLGCENETQGSHADEPIVGQTTIAGQAMPVQRFVGIPPNQHATGDIESMDLLAGQSVRTHHRRVLALLA
jgi:hypothetical protein